MNIRLATLDDHQAITRVHVDSWHHAFSQFAPALVAVRGDLYPRRLECWQKNLQDDALFTYVALEDNAIIGFGQGGSVSPALELPHYDGELIRLYVAPAHLGKGIGKALIHQVARTLQAQGKRSMVVVSWTINQPARNFYEHLGAEFVQENKREWRSFDKSQTVYVWQDIQTIIEATQS